jgi:ectoine hydroxylase-related dioxygenase (phytanoyl-CoA dioxygenase family)
MEFINEDQHRVYWDKGYLVVEQFFSEKETQGIYRSLRKVASKDFEIMLHLDRAEDLFRQSPDSEPADREEVSKVVREVQVHKRMVGILEELYGREMVVVQSIMIYKEADTPFCDQAWNPHQDNSYVQNPNGMYLAVGYPLLDHSPENGGLYIYPGSHKENLLPMRPVEGAKQKAGESPGNICDVPDKYEKVDIHMNKGDVLIMHGNLIHGSYSNHSKMSRPFLITNYLPDGEEFLPGKTSQRRVIRCR